ncbi:MAG: TAXI family TRAP transporter solute-binding subunit [Candidatus Riflebacteria bacterium]|nr:TAXI family TRAP transporter solute-binding subunit [Candidatus Riflebacteria bacterium]
MNNNRRGILPSFVWPIALVMATLALLLLAVPEPPRAEAPIPPQLYSSSFQLIGTGNRLGTYYPVGNVLSKWINSQLGSEGVFKPIETNGSIDNVRLIIQGKVMLAMAESRIIKENMAENASSPLRLVWPLWNDVVHILRAPERFDPGESFPGRLNVFLGQLNSSTRRTSLEIIDALGLYRRKTSAEIPIEAVLNSLANGSIGYATIQAGMPNRTVSDAVNFHGCSLISLSDAEIEKILQKVSTSRRVNIAAGFYGESQPEIHTVGLPNMLVASVETSDEAVGLIIDSIAKGASHLRLHHQAIGNIPVDPEVALKIMQEAGVPIHPGTLAWIEKNAKGRHAAVETGDAADE